MALDGLFLHIIRDELEREAVGGRVDKIHQPSRDEMMIVLRVKAGNRRILLSTNAASPRVQFTDVALENPKSPPMFCMLMRKHLGNGKLVAVRQAGLDRILFLDFEAVNELGDLVTVTVAMEIMGKHSNLVLINAQGKIIDAIKRVTEEMSGVRPVLPGMTYTLPPARNRLDLTQASDEDIGRALEQAPQGETSKALMAVLEGVSPIVAREAAFYACRGAELRHSDWTTETISRLTFFLKGIRERFAQGNYEFTVISELTGKPRDFTFLPVHQYGAAVRSTTFSSPGELLDSFYGERGRIDRMKQRSHDLLKLLVSTTERLQRKAAAQQEELKACRERDTLKMYGDLLNANLYRIEKGISSVRLENFYEEGCPSVDIEMNPMLTPVQNVQRYYSEYRKAATAEQKLVEQIEKAKQEIDYLDTVFDALSRTTGESELLEIRQELYEQGYVRQMKSKQMKSQAKSQPPIKYRSSDGYTILVGRNNLQNDKLTLKTAGNYDMWLHTHNIPGSHVIIDRGSVPDKMAEIPDRTIEEAAIIAAYNSKAREGSQVPVDYTLVRNVKKPGGAKPGMVIFENYKTAFVTPDESLVKRLLVAK